jgi:hypothetical protein
MPRIGNKKYSYDAAGIAAYNRDKKRMQGGGEQAMPVSQEQQPALTHPQPNQQSSNPCDTALMQVATENEKLKQQLQMSQIQMQKMAMIMEGKTPPSEARTTMGAKNTPKKRGGSVRKKRGGSCGLKMKRV